MPSSADRFDVVGIGALNVDYLAGAFGPELPGLEWGTERSVDAAVITSVVAALDPARSRVTLGGSAFNAITAMARAGRGLRLGYVGVAGRVPGGRLSAWHQLDTWGIDRRHVFRDDERLCGVCVSLMRGGERTLVTHAGANAAFPDRLDEAFDEVVAYLSRARLIHVTSFLDERSAGRLRAVLGAVKELSPRTRVCLDPGHVWSADGGDDVDGLVRLSDFLLVNRRELHELAGGDAERLVGRMPGGGVLVVKEPGGVRWSQSHGAGGFVPQPPLTAAEIVDATGAGDAFAAGLLLELAAGPDRTAVGCELGLRLARRKLVEPVVTEGA